MSYRHGSGETFAKKLRPYVDLIHGNKLRECCKGFKRITMETKRYGLGGVEHHPPINDAILPSYMTTTQVVTTVKGKVCAFKNPKLHKTRNIDFNHIENHF